VNTWIKTYGTTNHYQVVDLNQVLSNPANGGQLNPSYAVDTVHLNAAGYEAWANAINITMITNYAATIPASQTSKDITIPLVNIDTYSGNKTLKFQLSAPTNAALSPIKLLTVNDIEADQLIYTLSASHTTIAESNTNITLTITANITATFDNTVNISATDDTAINGQDYVFTNQVITIPAGRDTANVVLSIKENSHTTSPKTFTVALSSPTGNATLGTPYSITIQINPNPKDLLGAKNNTPTILAMFGLMFLIPTIIAAFIIITMIYTREVNPIILVGAVIGIGLFFIVLIVMLFLSGEIMTIVNP
jgi:hypothetical protein